MSLSLINELFQPLPSTNFFCHEIPGPEPFRGHPVIQVHLPRPDGAAARRRVAVRAEEVPPQRRRVCIHGRRHAGWVSWKIKTQIFKIANIF